MAIRDHFRLDVLVRRAAVLQERDAELAEVERLLRMEDGAIAGVCPQCAAPHAAARSFCWQCGAQLMERLPSTACDSATQETQVMDGLLAQPAHRDRIAPTSGRRRRVGGGTVSQTPAAQCRRLRLAAGARVSATASTAVAGVGPRGPQLLDLIVPRAGEPDRSRTGAAAARAPAPQGRRASWDAGRAVPSPGVCALLVLGFLGFGVLMGSAASSGVQAALAASTAAPKLLVLAASALGREDPRQRPKLRL